MTVRKNVAASSETFRHLRNPRLHLNVGDVLSNPLLYFPFPDFEIYGLQPRKIGDFHHLILGGGGLWHNKRFCHAIGQLCRQSTGKKIAWGVGHNFHREREIGYRHQHMFDLFGSRDWGHSIPGVDWVPCASCFHEDFDAIAEPDHEIVAFVHHRYPFAVPIDVPAITNFRHPDSVIPHISSGAVVVTSSYHGAYWATLAGRKVVLRNPFSTKFRHMRFPPTIWQQGERLESAISRAVAYPEALQICRQANRTFYAKVRNEI